MMKLKVIVIVFMVVSASFVTALAAPAATSGKSYIALLDQRPLAFEPVVSHPGADSVFISRAAAYDVAVTGTTVNVSLQAANQAAKPAAMSLVLWQAKRPQLTPDDQLPSTSNYYVGPPAEWRTGVPQYRAILGRQVYPGIDVEYRGNQRQLEYVFRVAPHARPEQIAIEAIGAEPVIAEDGSLRLHSSRDLVLRKPFAYQFIAGKNRAVMAKYVLREGRIGIALGPYDRRKALIIDPVLAYSTYLGGTAADTGTAVAVERGSDGSETAYITGQTCSTNLTSARAYGGNCDAYVTALKGDGSAPLYTTYIGGENADNGKAIAVRNGVVTVAGTTNSTHFPVQGLQASSPFQATYGGGDTDAFITRLDASGQLLYSTYLGGSQTEDGNGIALDSAGNIIVAGQTGSGDFPVGNCSYGLTLTGLFSAFVTKLDAGTNFATAAFSRHYEAGKYPPPDFIDTANAVATDLLNDIYIGGTTRTSDFTKHDALAVAAKFKSSCDPVYTWLLVGGTTAGDNLGRGIAVDASGNAILVGATGATDASVGSAFVLKLNPLGSDVVFSKTLAPSSVSNAVAVDGNGAIYVSGTTSSTDFPAVSPTQSVLAGSEDAFVTKLNQSGSVEIFSSFFGGADSDTGNGVAVSPADTIYVAGTARSLDLRIINGLPANDQGVGDAFLAKWTGARLPYASLNPLQVSFGDQPVSTASSEQSVTLSNLGDASLMITGINAGTDFAQHNDCGALLPAGGACTVKITFIPTATGIRNSTITISDSATNSPQTISLVGNGVTPVVAVSPTTLSFPDTVIALSSAPQTVTVTNSGAGALTMGDIKADGDFAVQTTTCAATLAAGASCTVAVSFAPTALGRRVGQLKISDNALNQPQVVALAGIGIGPSVLLSTSSLAFGQQQLYTTSPAQTVTVTNQGNTDLTIISVSASGDFRAASGCGTTVAAGKACTISVTFTPTAAGARSGTLTLTDNASGSPRSVSLSGTGIGASVSVIPGSLSFPSQMLQTESAAKAVTLTNTSSGLTVNIRKVTVSGDFKLKSNTCSGALAAGGSCTLSVSFSPTEGGARRGAITIEDDSVDQTHTVALAGTSLGDFALTATSTTMNLSAGQSASLSLTATPIGAFAQRIDFACTGAPAGATCTVAPAFLTLDGHSAASITATITTQARAALVYPGAEGQGYHLSGMRHRGQVPWSWAFGVVGIAALCSRRRIWAMLLVLILCLVLLWVGCGGAGGKTQGSGAQAGTYPLTIAGTYTDLTGASSPVTRTTTVTLQVK